MYKNLIYHIRKNNGLLWVILIAVIVISCSNKHSAKKKTQVNQPDWTLAPFKRVNKANPVITPKKGTKFDGPVLEKSVFWEANHTFNPAAVARSDTIFLLYRAEGFKGTSRIGLA